MPETIDINKLDASFLHLDRRGHPQHFAVMVQLGEGRTISLAELADRVRVRANDFAQFHLVIDEGRWRPPTVRFAENWDGAKNVSERTVADDHQVSVVLGELLAQPLPRDKPLWHITLLNQKAVNEKTPHRQYVVLRVHHALADGMTSTGYGMLFLDGSPAELDVFKRFLDSDRFVLDGLSRDEKMRAMRSFHGSWLAGCTPRRWPRPTNSGRNDVTLISVPTKQLYARAKALSVSTRELVLAASGVALYQNPLSNFRRPRTIRTSLPCTLDSSFRHVGNGTSITVVNLDGRVGDIEGQLASLRPQLQRVDRDRPELAIPIMSSPSNLPWAAQRVFTNSAMKVMRLDVEVGVNPAAARFRSVFGRPVTRVYPVPFLLSTSLCVAGLVAGDYTTFGIVTDGGRLPGYSHKFGYDFKSLIVESQESRSAPSLDSGIAG